MSQELYWIWLAEQCGAGSSIPAMISGMGLTAKDVFDGALDDIWIEESTRATLQKYLNGRDLSDAERILDMCSSGDIHVITPESELYPAKLRAIRDFPAVLYVKGSMPVTSDRMLTTVVGTRTMTDYGRKTAYALGAGLAFGGSMLVSGMALGADSMAIIGAMEAGGTIIAVLGSGVDVIYPREHRDLYKQIQGCGAVISEFRPGTAPSGRNFPIRNRIMSGLSDATVVVEAGEKSGALITAATAVKQGRTLFAVPGRVGDDGAAGTNQLICDGAVPVTTAEDVLSEFAFMYEKTVSVDRAHTMLHGLNMEDLSKTAMTRGRISTSENRGEFYGRGAYGGKYRGSIPETRTPEQSAEPKKQAEETKPTPVNVKPEPAETEKPKKKTEQKPAGKTAEKTGISGTAKTIFNAVFPSRKESAGFRSGENREKSEEKMIPAKKIELDMLDENEIKVYNRMKPSVPVMPEELADDSLDVSGVLSALTVLEMAGAVESGGSGYYMRIQPDDIMQSPND